MSKTPILLIQWLTDPNDGTEATEAFARFRDQVEIEFVDTSQEADSKQATHQAILNWATDNEYAQAVFIGSHGFGDRLGPTGETPSDDQGIRFEELWTWLQEAHELTRSATLNDKIARSELLAGDELDEGEGRLDVWLGACNSADVVPLWPLTSESKPWPVSAIVGFASSPFSSAVATFLDILMSEQQIQAIAWTDEIRQRLIAELPDDQPVVFVLDEETGQWQSDTEEA